MKIPRTAKAFGHIDDTLIAAATESNKQIRRKRVSWPKWGAAAACFVALILAGTAILPSLFGGTAANPGDTGGRYKAFDIQEETVAIVWPWEYLTVSEKYTETKIDGVKYSGTGRTVSASLLGDLMGACTVSGYDEITEKKYTADFEAYQLRNVAKNQFIAVEMEGKHYVFKNAVYDPPKTLGDLFQAIDFQNVLRLSRFSENGGGLDDKWFALNSDAYVWEVLENCKTAAFVEDEHWWNSDRDYLSFTITSEALGVFKAAMYITEDGYLWTNMFDWAYIFDIGEDAAAKIIQYVKENSTETEYEPFINTVAGRVTEITEEYILLDDSILCKDPADGITYKILLNDIRVSRYIENNVIRVGETVQVVYEGELDEKNSNIIDSAVSMSEITISEGEAFIPE